MLARGGGLWLLVLACAPVGRDGDVARGPVPDEGLGLPVGGSVTPVSLPIRAGSERGEPFAGGDADRMPSPRPGTVTCGELLTRSVRLTKDVGPCTGDALQFGDHDLTLDCDGHAIRGAGTGRGVVVENKVRVTVKNCRIEGFTTPLESSGSTASRFLDNNLVGLGVPGTGCINIHAALGERYARNELQDCWVGMYVLDSSNLDVEYNQLVGGLDGIYLAGVNEGHRVRRNEAIDVGRDPVGGSAFLLTGEARGNRFDQNEVQGGGFGFSVYGMDAEGNRFERNHVEDVLRSGFLIWGEDNLVRYNTVERAANDGFRVYAAFNVLDHNEAWDSSDYGFHVGAGASHTLVDHSRACGSGLYDRYDDVGAATNAWIDSDFCTRGGF